jgi:hypothetical protein
MKKIPKILTIAFLSIFILQMICLIILLIAPQESRAAEANFTPQVSIGDGFEKGEATVPSIAKYIQAIYNYAIGIVGILAAVVLMFGGVRWMMAGGSPDKIGDAKAWIGASISGLILALASYMILNTINPDLVSFKEIAPPLISARGCCEKIKNGGICSSSTTEDQCESGWREGDYICEDSKCLSADQIQIEKCANKGGQILLGNKSSDCGEKCKPKNYLYSSFSYKSSYEYYCCICDPCETLSDGTNCGESNGGKYAVCRNGECSPCAQNGQNCSFNWCCEGMCCEDNGLFDVAECIVGTPTNGKYCN